ncbi:MAG: hypothetical protein AAF890_05635 [Pseudomonadota bacterium]
MFDQPIVSATLIAAIAYLVRQLISSVQKERAERRAIYQRIIRGISSNKSELNVDVAELSLFAPPDVVEKAVDFYEYMGTTTHDKTSRDAERAQKMLSEMVISMRHDVIYWKRNDQAKVRPLVQRIFPS